MIIQYFHYLSFLKYVFFVWGAYLFYPELFSQSENYISNMGMGIFFMGLGMCLDSLKKDDKLTTLEKKIFKNEKYYRSLIMIGSIGSFLVILGSIFLLKFREVYDFALGMISFSIGLLSVAKQNYSKYLIYKEQQI